MRAEKHLIVGAFYWVIPEVDPDAEDRDLCEPGLDWQDEIQPARFNGWNAAGEMLWNFLGFDGSSNWQVLWVGGGGRGADRGGASPKHLFFHRDYSGVIAANNTSMDWLPLHDGYTTVLGERMRKSPRGAGMAENRITRYASGPSFSHLVASHSSSA